MKLEFNQFLLITLFIASSQASWIKEESDPESDSQMSSVTFNISSGVGSNYSSWGSGVTDSLKSSIIKLINQGQAYHGADYEKHANYISTELSKLDSGTWNVLLIPSMKLKNSSDKGWKGFGARFWVYQSKYAILYEECQYNNKLSHVISKRSASTQKYVSSRYTSSNMDNSLLTVVSNTIKAVASTTTLLYSVYSDVPDKLQSYNDEHWSCVAMDFYYNSEYIDAYGVIYNYYPYLYASFQNTIKLKDGNGINVLVWQQ